MGHDDWVYDSEGREPNSPLIKQSGGREKGKTFMTTEESPKFLIISKACYQNSSRKRRKHPTNLKIEKQNITTVIVDIYKIQLKILKNLNTLKL